MSTPTEGARETPRVDESCRESATGPQTRARSRAASATSGRSGTQRPPLLEQVSKSNWMGRTNLDQQEYSKELDATAAATLASVTQRSEGTPWSDLDEDEGLRKDDIHAIQSITLVPGSIQDHNLVRRNHKQERAAANHMHAPGLYMEHGTPQPKAGPARASTFPSFQVTPQGLEPFEVAISQPFGAGIKVPTSGVQRETRNLREEVKSLVATEFALHEYRIQMFMVSQIFQLLSQFATIEQVQTLQQELLRLRTLVVDLSEYINKMSQKPRGRSTM